MTVAGNIWIMAPAVKVQEVASWMARSMVDPRFAVHPNGCAIAVAFSSVEDEILFDLKWPELRYSRIANALVDANPLLMRNFGRMSKPDDTVTVETLIEDGQKGALVTVQCPSRGNYRQARFFPTTYDLL